MKDARAARRSTVVGIAAIGFFYVLTLFIGFAKLNATFLVGWAFNIAASANLPALIMLLFWKRTTKQGITWAIFIGLIASLGWVLLSKEAFQNVYHYSADAAAKAALVPWSQPGILTIPLGFAVLIAVSLLTRAPKAVQN